MSLRAKAPSPELWAVACTDLHIVVGPFTNLADATKAARKLTDDKKNNRDRCVFIPAPFTFYGTVVPYEQGQDPTKAGPDYDKSRGYL